MEAVRELRKKYCPTALFVAIVAGLIMILLGHRELARGLVLGTLFSILNFVMMGLSIQLRMQKTRSTSTAVAMLLVIMRFGLLAVPLIVAISYDKYHILGAIVGIFMVQAVILTEALGKTIISRQV